MQLGSVGLACAGLASTGCDASSSSAADAPAGSPPAGTPIQGSIAQKYRDYFPIGAAVSDWHLTNTPDILANDFNHITAENAMKTQDVHPTEDTFNWEPADRIADFARSHGMKMTGHTLLWHRQTPTWMFAGVTAGDSASLELVKQRLKSHIEAVIGRYHDVVDNWDVANEVISDSGGKTYRDAGEGSRWYELFGNQDFVYWAFQYAHDALEAIEPGSSAGKLYYNDYLVTQKVDKILSLLAWLETKGIRADGVGFQSHDNLGFPSTNEIQRAMDSFVAAGYKVKISELDVTVYNDYATGSFVASPQVEYTASLSAKQASRYGELFGLYRANRANITSVTLWGISDDQSWLNNEPVKGRKDYPLLYNEIHQPKAARDAVLAF